MAEVAPKIKLLGKVNRKLKEQVMSYLFFTLALLTAYLVMAATFNSFVHPFIIILTVPLAILGS